jgi:hypothetical protein
MQLDSPPTCPINTDERSRFINHAERRRVSKYEAETYKWYLSWFMYWGLTAVWKGISSPSRKHSLPLAFTMDSDASRWTVVILRKCFNPTRPAGLPVTRELPSAVTSFHDPIDISIGLFLYTYLPMRLWDLLLCTVSRNVINSILRSTKRFYYIFKNFVCFNLNCTIAIIIFFISNFNYCLASCIALVTFQQLCCRRLY